MSFRRRMWRWFLAVLVAVATLSCTTGCSVIPLPTLVVPPAPVPGDQSAEGLFPEDARAVPLSSLPIDAPDWPADARYNFERCETVARAVTPDVVRIHGRDVDAFRDLLFPDSSLSCMPDQCFVRLNTAHVGRTVTITESGIACDDPELPGLGQCDIGIHSPTPRGVNAQFGYRGNVIVADRIRISGSIRLGYLALVLVAREEIEFLAGSEILGAQMLVPPQQTFGLPPLRQFAGHHAGACIGIDPTTHQRIYGDIDSWRYAAFDLGESGEPSTDKQAATLVMISPRIRGSGTIALHGFPGGQGANGMNAECHFDDSNCRASLGPFRQLQPSVGSDGAPGGPGGAGGVLMVRSHSPLPPSIITSVAGGEGGAGGLPGHEILHADCVPSPTEHPPLGVVGARGQMGPAGRIDFGELGDHLATYAYLLGGRGVERHMSNALFYARDVRDPRSVEQAMLDFAIVDGNYCHVQPPLVIRRWIPQAAPAAPLFSTSTQRRHQRFCDEVATRWRRVREGINYFGFPREFFMYTRPDIVHAFRTRAIDTADALGAVFWSTVQHEHQAVDAALLQQQAETLIGEKLQAAQAAKLRHELLLQKVVISIDRMNRNNDSLALMGGEIQWLRQSLEPMLEPDCDVLCVLGDVFSFIGAIVETVASIGTAISNIGDFIGGQTTFDFDSIVSDLATINSLYPATDPAPTVLETKLSAVAIWTEQLVTQVGKLPGLVDVGSAVFDIVKKIDPAKASFETLAATVEGPQTPLQMLAVVSTGNAQAESKLVSSLRSVNGALGSLENRTIRVRDQPGAIGVLKQMHDLILQRLELTRESQRLVEENLLASLEATVAGAELVLAQLGLDNAQANARRLGCRTGAVTGEACSAILPVATASQLRDVRDDVCRIAHDANDTVLLLDYLYHRARDFVDLADRAATGDPAAVASHNLRRNFLIPADRQTLARTNIDALAGDFLDVLRPMAEGVHRDGFCRPGATCTFASSADNVTNDRVMADLLNDGRTRFEVGTPVPERQRQRVTHFDLRVHAAPPYRLGCDGLTPCPTTNPPDLPFSRRYDYAYAHDPAATFEVNDGALRVFYFSPAYPTIACEAVQARLAPAARRWDCRSLATFSGAGAHESVIANQLASSYDINRQNYSDNPDIFGTSVRGPWSVDIRQTLVSLGVDDGCYAFDSGPLPTRCYPSQCLSPCFDAAGNRRSPTSDAPAFCGCYDTNGNLADTTTPGCHVALPPQLSFVLSGDALPAKCQTDTANMNDYRRTCMPYLDSGQLQPHGDEQCCTESGLLKPNLTQSERQSCRSRGLGSDATCRTPDICYEICGPRCKAFKEAFSGFEYRIYWRAQ